MRNPAMMEPVMSSCFELLINAAVTGKMVFQVTGTAYRDLVIVLSSIMPKKHALCSVEDLLRMLEARAKVRGHESEKGLPRRANAQYDIMVKLSCELLRRGQSGRQAILTLLECDHPYVREWAAFIALEFEPSRGEKVLEEIGQNYTRGLGFSAKFTLQQWRKGELKTISQWACKDPKNHLR
jgi:hypothetical protein